MFRKQGLKIAFVSAIGLAKVRAICGPVPDSEPVEMNYECDNEGEICFVYFYENLTSEMVQASGLSLVEPQYSCVTVEGAPGDAVNAVACSG